MIDSSGATLRFMLGGPYSARFEVEPLKEQAYIQPIDLTSFLNVFVLRSILPPRTLLFNLSLARVVPGAADDVCLCVCTNISLHILLSLPIGTCLF